MQVFVLLGCIDYEGDTLLGVYSSREAAEAAYEVYVETQSGFDDHDIVERTLDTAAEL